MHCYNSPVLTPPLPPETAFFACAVPKHDPPGTLFADEISVAASMGRPQRRAEFAAGRLAARRALALLNPIFGSRAIPRSSDRSPCWPEETIGAISHTGEHAAALVARRSNFVGVGLDIESSTRRLSPRLAARICRQSESRWVLSAQSPADQQQRLLQLFSAKETLYKAVAPIINRFFGFQDAELLWDPALQTFTATLDRSVAGALTERLGFIPEMNIRRHVMAMDGLGTVDGLLIFTLLLEQSPRSDT